MSKLTFHPQISIDMLRQAWYLGKFDLVLQELKDSGISDQNIMFDLIEGVYDVAENGVLIEGSFEPPVQYLFLDEYCEMVESATVINPPSRQYFLRSYSTLEALVWETSRAFRGQPLADAVQKVSDY